MPSWDDFRFLLAVYRARSLAGAARELGVEHTTVGRRVAALEQALGTKLVDRTPDGIVLTRTGVEVLPLVEELERTVLAIGARASGEDARIEGTVRLTTSEGLTGFLVKRLAELRANHPKLVVEVLSGNASLDLARREADLAVRMMRTTQPDLVAKKIGAIGWSLYATEDYVARKGALASAADLRGHDIVAFDEQLSGIPGAVWLDKHADGTNVVLRGNSIVSVLNAVSVGMGVGALPCFMGAGEPTLRRLTREVIGEREIWLVFHPEVAKIARVRAVMDFIEQAVAREDDLFRG